MHITAKGPTKPNILEKNAPNIKPANYPSSSENSIHVTTLFSSFLYCAVASARAQVCIRPAPMPSMILPRKPRIKKLIGFSVHTKAIINTQEIAYRALPILRIRALPHFCMRLAANTEDKSKVTEYEMNIGAKYSSGTCLCSNCSGKKGAAKMNSDSFNEDKMHKIISVLSRVFFMK